LRIERIPKEDLFSVFFVRKPGARISDFYFNAIDALRTIFTESRFREIVSGFYLNHIGPLGNSWVRISYFVSEANSTDAVSIFRNFFRERGILEDTGQFQAPHQATLAAAYGGAHREGLFRYFLALETQIGLDLMKADLSKPRFLFVTYQCARWHRLQTGGAPLRAREYFEPFFVEHSETYTSLPKEERDQFFSDLEFDGWVHFMINLVVGDDPQRPLSVLQMNDFLRARNLELQIPLDWEPEE
jgi:hypothetical protein